MEPAKARCNSAVWDGVRGGEWPWRGRAVQIGRHHIAPGRYTIRTRGSLGVHAERCSSWVGVVLVSNRADAAAVAIRAKF